jgi:hypothetical protein
MRYVILRDDDVSGLTPPWYLERLHRPWLDARLPVNLAVIPKIYSDLTMPGGALEGFLVAKPVNAPKAVAIGSNGSLTDYLKANPGYHLALHGYHHSESEFDHESGVTPYYHWRDVAYRLDHGEELFKQAGLPAPVAFVPPYGRFSRVGLWEFARRYRVVSATEFTLQAVPWRWAGHFAWRNWRGRPHWRGGNTCFLTHGESPLRNGAARVSLVDAVQPILAQQLLTVLPMCWWEFFPKNQPDERRIADYHALAEWLAQQRDLKVVSFADVAAGTVPV